MKQINNDINIGKMPPFDIELEKVIIGALILEPDSFLRVSDILTPFDFYKPENGILYEAIQTLFANNIAIDMISVMNEVKSKNKLEEIGGAYYISQCTERVAAAANIEHHASILLELSIRRDIIYRTQKIVNSSYDLNEPFDYLLNNLSIVIDSVLRNGDNKAQILTFSDNVDKCIESIKLKQKNLHIQHKNNRCTELTELRKLISQYEGGNLIVVAGRPGMGKTAIAVNEACELAYKSIPVLIFSLEMSAIELTNRIIQRETGLSKYNFEKQMDDVHWSSIESSYSFLKQQGIFIDDTPLASFNHIRSKAKIFKQMHNIQAIFIDYLQLMSADNKLPREQQVAEITKRLKALAKELDVPIFLLAQLNREVEKRSDKKPLLSDLRESGAIEQDADIIIFPTRPEYYWKDDPQLKGIAIIDVAKNRSGSTGEVLVRVNETVTKFFDEEPLAF